MVPDLVEIPAGSVVQGTALSAITELVAEHADLEVPGSWFLKECPAHEVHVPGFSLSRTPVTVAQYNTFASSEGMPSRTDDDALPVHGVTFDEAGAFCAWAASQTGLALRLPTESEWERAASPFGILDMAGNVDEWTATTYAPYPGAPEVPSPSPGRWMRMSHAAVRGSTAATSHAARVGTASTTGPTESPGC